MKKETKIESKERNYRRHEVTFSQIEDGQGEDYLDNYLIAHQMHLNDESDQEDAEITSHIMYRTLYNFVGIDREILLMYMSGEKQKDIAENFNISPSAVNQRIKILLENYRIYLCNDKDFHKMKEYRRLRWENQKAFIEYIDEIKRTGVFKIDVDSVQNFIKDIQQTIKKTANLGADKDIKRKLQKQIDYSNLDDKYIQNLNDKFAELGIEANFEKLKTFKGNVLQIIKMVDDFIKELKEKCLK